MLIAARNAMMAGKRLPYDAEVEYLKGDSASWIDTGIAASNSLDVEVTAKVTSFSGNPYLIGFGKDNDWPYNNSILIRAAAAYGALIFVRGAYPAKPTVAVSTFKTVRLNKSSVVTDGVSQSFSGANVSPVAGCKVFVFAGGGTSTAFGICGSGVQIKAAKVFSNDVCIWDGIAVRIGTEGAMYDRVSGALFRNQGTGDFVIGPDI